MGESEFTNNASSAPRDGLAWTGAALGIAAVGAAGSLWLSIGLGLKACPLCLYQRTFVLAVVGVLAVGLLTDARRMGLLNVLALPAATGGLGVAVFHEYLELTGKLECPAGVLGLGTAPQQSLALFVVLSIVLAMPLLQRGRAVSLSASSTAFILGLLFAFATIKSAPSMPSPPDKPYAQPAEMCRPPFDSSVEEGDSR